MKRTHLVSVLSVGVLASSLAIFQGCSSSSSDNTAAVVTKRPPTKPSGPATSDTSTKTFAVQTLFLGDAPRSGPASSDAWKKFGYDLDGKITTKDSTDVCKQASGGDRTTQADGDTGIDNSFGENLMPIINQVSPTAAADLNSQLAKGAFTLLFTVTGLSDDAAQSATGLSGFMNAGGAFDTTGQKQPTFTTADNWPVLPELLTNPADPKSSKIQFPDAYVSNGTWVNGSSDGKITITLSFGGQNLDLTIEKAIVTFDHKSPTGASNGVIAGLLNTEALISGLTTIAGRLSPGLCTGDGLKTITDKIRAYSDIMTDGSQDPSKTCDAITIGLGFEAKEIANPTLVAPPAQAGQDPCAASDAGTDGSVTVDSGSDAGTELDAAGDSASDAGVDSAANP